MKVDAKLFKSSMFNEYLGCVDEKWIIYNNLSSAMIDVPRNFYVDILNNRLDSFSSQNIDSLSKAKFVVEKDKNELDGLIKKKEEINETAALIGLQILPTSDCIFSCDYCFEKQVESGGRMSRGIIKSCGRRKFENGVPYAKIKNDENLIYRRHTAHERFYQKLH